MHDKDEGWAKSDWFRVRVRVRARVENSSDSGFIRLCALCIRTVSTGRGLLRVDGLVHAVGTVYSDHVVAYCGHTYMDN